MVGVEDGGGRRGDIRGRGPTSHRAASLWDGGGVATASSSGRLYARLVAAGVLVDGPRDAVRFFSAAVRARDVGDRPVALLRWIVEGGRWEVVTDRQDEQGDREWKAWRREAGSDPWAEWDLDGGADGEPGEATTCAAEGRQSPRHMPPQVFAAEPLAEAVPHLASRARRLTGAAPAGTVAEWPPDVRALVGHRALGKARGWDAAISDRRLARRDGWDEGRVHRAEVAAREMGLLDE